MPDSEASPITRRQLLADFGAAATASFTAAPLVTTIDSAITKTAANAGTALGPAILKEAAVLRRQPMSYITSVPNRWLFMLFFGTFFPANIADTCSHALGISPTVPVLLASTTGNMLMSSAKDFAFARRFSVAPPRAAPLAMLLCFLLRDGLSSAAFFTMPPRLSSELQARVGWSRGTSDVAAQLVMPVAMQVPCSPLHLLGLDVYNTPHASPVERLTRVAQQLPATTAARAIRIVPAFGLGGILNKRMRHRLARGGASADPSQSHTG